MFGKIVNSVLNNRLQKYLDKEKNIMPNQVGFQPKARTADHMFILRTVIEKSLANNNKLYVCFVDFAKAFDTVLHSALLYKLRKNNLWGIENNKKLQKHTLSISTGVHNEEMCTFSGAPTLISRQGRPRSKGSPPPAPHPPPPHPHPHP